MRHDRPDYSTWTELQLWQRYLELVPYHRTYFAHHLFTTYMATVPVESDLGGGHRRRPARIWSCRSSPASGEGRLGCPSHAM
ncbi:MAG: hypothetical protein R2713_00365 [Ilumatobacteraceae bacterium]